MAEHHDNERIRGGLSVLVDDAPLAPDFHDLTTTHVRPVATRKPRSYFVAGVSAAAVLATFAVGTILLDGSGGAPVGTPEVSVAATTPTTLADLAPGEFPRVVLGAAGWSMDYLDHSEGENEDGEYASSEIQFVNGSAEAELRMNSGWQADFEALVADRTREGERLDDHPIWDTTAAVVGSAESEAFAAMWESNAVEYEFVMYDVDNARVDEATFRSILAGLTQTTEEEWIEALPDEIVTDRAAAIATYLEDIPLPPNFDVGSLEEGPIEHWYGVAADTVGAVTCSWIEVWIDGNGAGDSEAQQRAVEAMASSDSWQVLADMSDVGDYPLVVREYSEAIGGDGTVTAGTVLTVEESYEQAFGCT